MKKLLLTILLVLIFGLTQLNAQEANFIYAGSLSSNQVVKFDSNGNDIWTYPASIYSLSVGSDDSVVIGDGSIVRKLDSNGNTLWTNSNHTSLVNRVEVDSFNNVITSAFDNTIRKFNSSGNQQWVYSVGQTVRSLAIDVFDNVLATVNNGDVIKLDSNGNLLWTYNHTGDNTIFGLDSDNLGNVYFGDNSGELVKLNQNGNFVWNNNDHNGSINNLAVDNNPFIYTASSDDTVRKFTGTGSQVWSFTGFSDDVRAISVDLAGNSYAGSENNLKKIDSFGNEVWNTTEINENIWEIDVHMPYITEPPTYDVDLNSNYDYADFIYIDNDGIVSNSSISTVIDNNEPFSITTSVITISPFTFNFWFDLDNSEIFTSNRTFDIIDPSQDYNLVANYSLNNSVNLSFNSNLPSPPNFELNTRTIENNPLTISKYPFNNHEHPFDYNFEITAPTTNIGFYEFDYWYDNNNNEVYSNNPLITSSGIENLNLTATYSLPEEYQINLTLESDVGVITFQHGTLDPITGTFISVTIGENDFWSATAPSNPDFQFNKWLDLDTLNDFSTNQTIGISNTTQNYNLRALYFELVEIEWDSNGGTPIPNQKVIIGSSVNPPNDPSRPQFVFDGWENPEGQKQTFPTNISEDITFTAIWLDTYTLTFDTNGGGRIDTKTYIDGETPEVVTPSRFGYTFEGWFTDDGTFQNEYNFTPITQDTTIHAKWAFGSDRDAQLSLTTFLDDNDLGDRFSQIIVMITIYVFVNIVIMIYQAPLVVTLILNFIVTSLFMILGWIAIWLVVVIFMALFGFLYFTSSGRGLTE